MDKIIPFNEKKKGVGKMATTLKEKKKKAEHMADIRRMIQNSMQEKNISSSEARKSLEIKRYED